MVIVIVVLCIICGSEMVEGIMLLKKLDERLVLMVEIDG